MEKKFYRSLKDRKIAGVCGGIAQYFGLDASIVRVITAILVLFTGIGLVAYIVAAVLLPNEPLDLSYPEEITPSAEKTAAEPEAPKAPKMPKDPSSFGSSESGNGNSNTNNFKKY